ncbi:MAG: hypothetical protein ACHQ9S_27435 [Candidatus Binatia bacterium]
MATVEPSTGQRKRRWATLALVASIAAFLSLTATGRDLASRFFASLRIAKPQPVSVNVPSFSGPNAGRQLQDAIGPMIADTVAVDLDEQDQPVANVESASRLAGFVAHLPRTRREAPMLVVMGARATAMTVRTDQLRTILREAGQPTAKLSPALEGGGVTIRTPRAIRAQYGHCPPPVANTLQGQIQGPPPPSTDYGDCVVLTQRPPASASVPTGLDVAQLVGIALELAGMSPNQARDFQKTFDWQSALSVSVPRFIRSYEMVDVGGAPGMLLNTAGRRGPSYVLIWAKGGMLYSLAGYGSSGDAVPLANATN